jgi:hypothetical protein
MDSSCPNVPEFWVTYAQTSLLLAEQLREVGLLVAEQLNSIMKMELRQTWMRILSIRNHSYFVRDITAYLAHPAVLYNATDA